MDMKNAYAPVVIGVAVGLVVGFAAGWYWTENKYSSNEDENNTTNEEVQVVLEEQMPESFLGSESAEATNESIEISEQEAGSSVVVDKVTLSESGWVAVREMRDGMMGNILGAKRIQNPGTISRVSVPLLRPTLSGETYTVVIYRDDGDRDFDFNFDALVVRGGDPVSATFQTN